MRELASSVFGWDDFRSGQRQAMQALLEGRNVLCVMPTGSGKSAIYQVPGRGSTQRGWWGSRATVG
ncbi:DEAD/DEAH box helicase [Arthrobacter zhaoguopingii]|uniref:DEAD/DEAH box helicase n=1 Tax=Arthrobacter zhaoguopingii TaxID=2681491 RepID=UPI0019156499